MKLIEIDSGRRLRRLDAQEELVHLQDPSLDAVEELLLDLTQT